MIGGNNPPKPTILGKRKASESPSLPPIPSQPSDLPPADEQITQALQWAKTYDIFGRRGNKSRKFAKVSERGFFTHSIRRSNTIDERDTDPMRWLGFDGFMKKIENSQLSMSRLRRIWPNLETRDQRLSAEEKKEADYKFMFAQYLKHGVPLKLSEVEYLELALKLYDESIICKPYLLGLEEGIAMSKKKIEQKISLAADIQLAKLTESEAKHFQLKTQVVCREVRLLTNKNGDRFWTYPKFSGTSNEKDKTFVLPA